MESFIFLRANFRGLWVFLLICDFVDEWVLVSVRKPALSKFVFMEDANSRGRASYEYHEN